MSPEKTVAAWMASMKGKTHTATIGGSGKDALESKRINDHLFALTGDGVYIGLGFKVAPTKAMSVAQLQAPFKHVALDRIPVPGVTAKNWQISLRTPRSSFSEGVKIEWKDGVIRLRVRTSFFAASGRRTDILVPADAGMPPGTFFQIRQPLDADLTIEGRLLAP